MPLDRVVALLCLVDVVILSYSAHNADFSKPLDPPQYTKTKDEVKDLLCNWVILMQKSNLIIVVYCTKSCKISHLGS